MSAKLALAQAWLASQRHRWQPSRLSLPVRGASRRRTSGSVAMVTLPRLAPAASSSSSPMPSFAALHAAFQRSAMYGGTCGTKGRRSTCGSRRHERGVARRRRGGGSATVWQQRRCKARRQPHPRRADDPRHPGRRIRLHRRLNVPAAPLQPHPHKPDATLCFLGVQRGHTGPQHARLPTTVS